MKFNEFVLKYRRILFISLATAISFLLLCLVGFYFWLNYHTMAQIGDFKITRKVVLDNVSKNKDYVLIVKGKDANLEKETYQIILEQKAVEYQSAKQGITVSDQELTDEISNLSEDGNSDTYYKTVSLSYGWSKEEANSQVRDRMLKEKLESSIVSSFNVKNFYVRSNTEPKQGETTEQIKTKALELATQARLDAIAGKSFQDIKASITAASPLTWNGDMTHGWSEVDGLNASNEADKLANAKFWPSIEKLSKAGDVTEVIDANNQGGLYLFWQLDSKTKGTYNNMTEFFQSFQPKNAINEFLLKMTPTAYAACSNWLNNNVNTPGEIAWYRVSHFEIKIREASTHAVITNQPSAHAVLANAESPTGHCDSSWCNMGQNLSLTAGVRSFSNTCCQFTYAVSITGLPGYKYVHTHRQGIEGGNDSTTSYPPHFNAINGIDNLYGQMDYSPITNVVTPSTIDPSGCSITPNTPQTVAYGASSTFTGVPTGSYVFDGFSIDSGAIVAGASYTFTNVTAAHTIQARCHNPIIPTAKVTVSAETGGTASVNPTPADTGAVVLVVNKGGSATMIAKATIAGYVFKGWGGDCVGAKCSLATFTDSNILGDENYIARFTLPGCTITATPNAGPSPLVVKVTVQDTSGSLPANSYTYNMGDGTVDIGPKGSVLYYNYEHPGPYQITVKNGVDCTSPVDATQKFVPVVVNSVNNGNGGEVSP